MHPLDEYNEGLRRLIMRQKMAEEERKRKKQKFKNLFNFKNLNFNFMKFMKPLIYVVSVLFIALLAFMWCFERIDAGHVGIKVNLYGSQKGVDGVTEVTGGVWFLPLTTKIYEFPINIRHKEYKGEEAFEINTKDGTPFRVGPMINYRVLPDSATKIFAKYRKDVDDIETSFLKVAIFDAFRMACNSYTADSLIGNREGFEARVRGILKAQFEKDGFFIEQFTSGLEYPQSFKQAIEAKNNAVQQALKAENDVKTAEAQAKIKVAEAEGNAQALLTSAKAEAEANRLKQQTLTPLLLQQEWIEAWKAGGSNVPQFISGDAGKSFMINLNK
jgi:regulator of protease activity HflC (stomatin/prohibitin superfamily)